MSDSSGSLSFLMRLAVSAIAVAVAGCDELRFPRDPDGTLEAVLESGQMTVAAVHHPPWVIDNGEALTGAEVILVEDFADDLGVTVEWRRLSAFAAIQGLEQGEVDLAIGGFTQRDISPHTGAAPTYVYFTSTLLVGAAPDAAIPPDLAGQKVLVTPDVMASQLVRDEGGVAVEETGPGTPVNLVALPNWQLEARGLVPSGFELRRDKHVMAVPQGENAWIMRLERVLRRASGGMAYRLREYRS